MDREPSSEAPRVTWVTGPAREGPRELIGVLEVREDGAARAVLAQRVEVDGRCHVLLARRAWGGKDALETRWWSLVMRPDGRAATVRNGDERGRAADRACAGVAGAARQGHDDRGG
jgi:hypothetical protein